MRQDDLTERVKEISGQNPFQCMQCGLCSASCTANRVMDFRPRQVMRALQLGRKEVLERVSIWMCTSCLTCTARCPRGIDIARVMEALRMVNLRRGRDVLAPEAVSADLLVELPQMALTSAFRKLSA